MAIPNTTPTPNELYNGEMRKMTDTELRVVLIVTRATLGWEINHETGMRKQEDWISNGQLREKTGRSRKAISTAINNCIKRGWIEARSKSGELLDTKEKRSGNKIYYRLGKIFLDKIKDDKTSVNSTKVEKPVQIVHRTSVNSTPQPVQIVHPTKEIHTKEIHTKEADKSAVEEITSYFYKQTYKTIGIKPEMNKKDAEIIEMRLKKYPAEKIKSLICWYLDSKIVEKLGATLSICLSTSIINQWKVNERMDNVEIPSYAKGWQK